MQNIWRHVMQKSRAMHLDVPVQYIYLRRPVFIWLGQHLRNVKVSINILFIFCLVKY